MTELDNPIASALDNPIASALDNPIASALDNPIASALDNPIASVMDMAKSQRELAEQIQQAIDENNAQRVLPVGSDVVYDPRLFQIQLTFLEMYRDHVLSNRFSDASALYETILGQADRFYQVLKDHV